MMRFRINIGVLVLYFILVLVQYCLYIVFFSFFIVSSNEFFGDYSIEGQFNGIFFCEENIYFRL